MKKQVLLRETDATKVIYFAEHFNFAMETFEYYLQSKQKNLGTLFEQETFFIPVVHAESDFKGPIFVGDILDLELSVKAIGQRSFRLFTEIKKEKEVMGTVEIVHVTVCKTKRTSIAVPLVIKQLLSQI